MRRVQPRARYGVVAAAAIFLSFAGARADGSGVQAASDAGEAGWPNGGLSFDLAGALSRDATAPRSQPADQPAVAGEPAVTPGQVEQRAAERMLFGRAGTTWLSIGGGAAWDFGSNSDVEGNVGWSLFLADALEFRLEAGLWYFNQDGNNTGAVSGIMMFHYHFLHNEDWSWTLFFEAGIGLMGAFDEVPDGGTGLVFTPRLGLGWTQRISDEGTRLELGARWRHLSNGRFEGDARNPARDSLMIFAEIVYPF